MRKLIVAAVIVFVLGIMATSVFAYGGRCGKGGMGGGMMGAGQGFANCPAGGAGMMGGMGMMRGPGRGQNPNFEIPQEIRDKQVEMQKNAIDLRSEMYKRPVDRTKVEALQKRNLELRNEISSWFMQQELDSIEKLQK